MALVGGAPSKQLWDAILKSLPSKLSEPWRRGGNSGRKTEVTEDIRRTSPSKTTEQSSYKHWETKATSQGLQGPDQVFCILTIAFDSRVCRRVSLWILCLLLGLFYTYSLSFRVHLQYDMVFIFSYYISFCYAILLSPEACSCLKRNRQGVDSNGW